MSESLDPCLLVELVSEASSSGTMRGKIGIADLSADDVARIFVDYGSHLKPLHKKVMDKIAHAVSSSDLSGDILMAGDAFTMLMDAVTPALGAFT